ncbi:putative isoflavone oxidoreductase [Bisporella sp. PMI_857]|nr:putative isoflavone oxidoreductase [Bisporella sp. PMI_857]
MISADSILVLGAGELGMAMLVALAQRKLPATTLTVLLRPLTIASSSPSKATEIAHLKSLGICILPGDVSSLSSSELANLFKPYDTIISCLGFASGPGSQVKLCKAVLEAGVQRYFPWQFGVDYDVIGRGSGQDVFDEQLDVRDLLRGQEKVKWVIVSTGMFTSFLFESYFGVVDLDSGEGVVRALGSWNDEVTVTTPFDIGKLTAEIVFTEPEINNQVVFTAGETINYGQLADVVEEVIGRRVGRELWTEEYLREELEKDPSNGVKKYRVVFASGKGLAWDMSKTFNAQQGIETEDVHTWARKNIKEASDVITMPQDN